MALHAITLHWFLFVLFYSFMWGLWLCYFYVLPRGENTPNEKKKKKLFTVVGSLHVNVWKRTRGAEQIQSRSKQWRWISEVWSVLFLKSLYLFLSNRISKHLKKTKTLLHPSVLGASAICLSWVKHKLWYSRCIKLLFIVINSPFVYVFI